MGEQDLRDRLQEVAEHARTEAVDYGSLWQEARGARRRRRRAKVAGAAFSALAVAGLLAAAPGLLGADPGPADKDPDGVATSTSTSDPDTDLLNPVGRWVAGLPQGTPPSRPYVTGSTLHNDGEEISLRDFPYTVLDAVPGGLLVSMPAPGGGTATTYGIRGPDGTIVPLGGGFGPQARLSTDRARLAVATDRSLRVYDLATRTMVDKLVAGGGVQLGQFTSDGVIYVLRDSAPSVWQPGSEPVPLPWIATAYSEGVLSDDLGRAVIPHGPPTCSAAAEVRSDSTQILFQDCGLMRPYTISPDGRHALTVDLRVVDLDSGTATRLSGAPGHSGQMPPVVWETDTDVLLTLRLTAGFDARRALVRCSVVTLECERLVEARTLVVLDATRPSS